MKRKWFAIILSLVISIAIIISIGVLFAGSRTILSTSNYKINNDILEYYIQSEKNNYVANYTKTYGKSFLVTVGLNPGISLKKQESCYGGTWYDYFRNEAILKLKDKLLYCEAIKQNNINLNENELKETENSVVNSANNISSSNLKIIAEIEVLSQKYLTDFKNGITVTQKQIMDYYKKNDSDFDCLDYDCIVIKEQSLQNNSNENKSNSTEKLVEKLVASIKANGFENTVKDFGIENNETYEIKEYVGHRFDDTTQFGNWAFSKDRKAGDVKSFGGRGVYTIYHIKRERYPLDYQIRNIQTISFNTDEEKSELDKLYKLSSKLSDKNNTDENLYSFSKELNLTLVERQGLKEYLSLSINEWLYNKERKFGDYTILKDGMMTTFVRYCGNGGKYFETKIISDIIEENIKNNLNELKNNIPIKE